MDNVLQTLFTWQFILFCLAVFGITLVLRRFFEFIIANYNFAPKGSKLWKAWRDLVLPILPAVVGIMFAIIAKAYPYPVDMKAMSARVAWGLAAGLLSGLGYRVVNSFVTSFIQSKLPGTIVVDPNLTDDLSTVEQKPALNEEKKE